MIPSLSNIKKFYRLRESDSVFYLIWIKVNQAIMTAIHSLSLKSSNLTIIC